MKLLPNGIEPVIPDEKLLDYCLNPDHEHGQHKALLFSKLLGITEANLEDLREILRAASRDQDIIRSKSTDHGTIYYIDSPVIRGERTFQLRSLWIVLNGEIIPRFVSCYLRRKGAKGNEI